MFTNISVPIPEYVQQHIHSLSQENFNLWLFIAQNDLLEEADEFLSCVSAHRRHSPSELFPFPTDDDDFF